MASSTLITRGSALTAYRLVDTVTPVLPIRDAAQARAGAESDTPRDDAGPIADDVAEEVARNNYTIEAAWGLDHDHGRAVDELVVQLQLRELGLHGLGDDLAPEAARGQHVGLVEASHGRGRAAREREVRRERRDALDLGPRARLRVVRRLRSPK